MSDPRTEALALWLHTQQEGARIAQQHQQPPGELHLHQHHHAAPPVPAPIAADDPTSIRVPPLVLMTYILFLSVALSLPLALIAAIVEAGSRPSVQYVQPSRGGW